MKLLIGNKKYDVTVINNPIKRFINLFNKKNFNNTYLYKKSNIIHTFLCKTNLDVLGLNNKDTVIYKYQNAPINKVIEIKNEQKNTNILVLPKNISKNIKINDVLTFINEYEI